MILFYSGTGNSRFAAKHLAERLGEELLDAFSLLRSRESASLASQRPWVFVAPTYGWRLPRLFSDLLERSHFAGSREAYFLLTCGSEIGNAGKYLRSLCEAKGWQYRGTFPLVMPENYIALFDAPAPGDAQEIVRAALPELHRAAAFIQQGQDFPFRAPSLLDRMKSTLVNPLFYRLIVKAKAFTVSDACTSCGRCSAVCPLGNIRLEGGKPIWGAECTHCMACICGCPAGAIEYGRASVGKPRYQCPDLSDAP